MNENTEVTLAQVQAYLALFQAVSRAKEDAVARHGEMCVDAVVWGELLDAYAGVAELWDW